MLRGSLEQANLVGANLKGTRLVDVATAGARCNGAEGPPDACAALDASGGAARSQALARVAWLRALPWPWD